ncbi:hypothetical protein K438DRAFT_1978401 [Mycena galopus ATCC 62051]|nr:hypothetical protein K438DRAFT_1978401 [Mycena galopus ATCC 62051]
MRLNSDNRYLQYPASICTDLAAVVVTATASPTCSVQNESTNGILVGTSGSVTLSSTQGTAYSVTSTVTETSSIAIGDSFFVKVTFPGEEYQNTFSVTSTFTNSLSTATQTTDNQQSTESIIMAAGEGQTCSLETTTSCSVTARGPSPLRRRRSRYISIRSGITSSTLSLYTGKCT